MPATAANEKKIGLEVTNTMLRAVIIAADLTSRQTFEVPFALGEPMLPRLVATLEEIKRNYNPTHVGIAVSGLVNKSTNRVELSNQFPGLADVDLAEQLTRSTGVAVHLENDANAAAYGEFLLGAGRGSRSLFFVTMGEGIGGSLILDGKLWRGANGFAGEFGHIAINEDGVKLEEVASAGNIVRRTKERLAQDSTSSLSSSLEQVTTVADIVAAARNGDDFAQLMLERTGAYIGTAVASVINLLNVERVVIGGELAEAERVIIESIARRARQRSFLPSFEATTIAAAELGADAAAVGAALLTV